MIDFFDYNNGLKPERGRLLVSEPFLPDPNFDRTVVLLCEHNEEGSFGFVLNKESEVSLGELMEDIQGFNQTVYVGGPVQHNTLHYIHRFPSLEGSVEIVNGLYWGGDFDQLVSLMDTHQVEERDIRFFVGYSGWDKDQLEEEMDTKSWIVANLNNPEIIFESGQSNMWKRVLRDMGGKFNVYSNYPSDPRLN